MTPWFLPFQTGEGGSQEIGGLCSYKTRAPVIDPYWSIVDSNFRNTALPLGSPERTRRRQRSPPGATPTQARWLSPEATPLGLTPSSTSSAARAPKSSSFSSSYGLPLTDFLPGPYLGHPRLLSSWRRFCAVGPSWPPVASSSAPGE